MDRMNINTWAENQAEKLTGEIISLIDCGMPKKDAIETTLKNSCIGNKYQDAIKESVKDYVHFCKPVLDKITGKIWCMTCQKFL